jgi:hypothetical protein
MSKKKFTPIKIKARAKTEGLEVERETVLEIEYDDDREVYVVTAPVEAPLPMVMRLMYRMNRVGATAAVQSFIEEMLGEGVWAKLIEANIDKASLNSLMTIISDKGMEAMAEIQGN